MDRNAKMPKKAIFNYSFCQAPGPGHCPKLYSKTGLNCQALVQVQSSPVQVEGLGLSLWSLLPTTTTTTANFQMLKFQKILDHHHHNSTVRYFISIH